MDKNNFNNKVKGVTTNENINTMLQELRDNIRKAVEGNVGGDTEVNITIPAELTAEGITKAVEDVIYSPRPHLTPDELKELSAVPFKPEGLPKGKLSTFPLLGVDFGKNGDMTTVSAMSRKGRSIFPRQSGKTINWNQIYVQNEEDLEIQEDLYKLSVSLESLKSNPIFADLKEPILQCRISKYLVSVNPTAPDEDIDADIRRQIEGQKANRAKNRADRRRQNQLKGRKRR